MRITPAVMLAVCLAACERASPWDVADVRSRLVAAGWSVTPAANPGIGGAGILSVACLDATHAGAKDTLCAALGL